MSFFFIFIFTVGTKSPIVATLALIRGETAKLDVFSLSQIDRPRIFSMLLFSWGMMADADIESDKYVTMKGVHQKQSKKSFVFSFTHRY